MLILEDTRQQEKKHEVKHDYFRQNDIRWNRTALYCGDYTLPADQSICIDTKFSIQELIGDIQVKQMTKGKIKNAVYEICEGEHISFAMAEKIYHTICDDDQERFVEDELNRICFANGISESVTALFQDFYIKRHGFFHRGLKRAQNSGIQLVVLVDNKEGVKSLEDLERWVNPRSKIMVNSGEIIGKWPNGKPKYGKKPKFPTAMSGDQLAKACRTMESKYGCRFEFCRPEEAGRRVIEILKKEA